MEVASEYFRSGADKISIGSDAVYAAEEYIKTGVCNIFNFFLCASLMVIYLIFFTSVFTDKNWKEQLRTNFSSLWQSGDVSYISQYSLFL